MSIKKSNPKKRSAENKLLKTRSESNEHGFFKKYFKEQEEKIRASKKRQFAFFVLGFLVAYLMLTSFVSIIPEIALKQVTGEVVQGLLSVQGIQTSAAGAVDCLESSWTSDTIKGECYSFYVIVPNYPICSPEVNCPNPGKNIVISWLCTGVLEIIILIAAIIASFGVSWKRKAIGIGVAVVLGIIFNFLRILITINLILTQNVQTVELAHDLLFRMILFIYIVAVYVIWFYWACGKPTEQSLRE